MKPAIVMMKCVPGTRTTNNPSFVLYDWEFMYFSSERNKERKILQTYFSVQLGFEYCITISIATYDININTKYEFIETAWYCKLTSIFSFYLSEIKNQQFARFLINISSGQRISSGL